MLTERKDAASAGMSCAIGTQLGNGYRILRLLGHGGQSIVYLARHEATGDMRAVKTLRPDAPEPCLAQRSFLSEAEILQNLCHPAIPAVVDLIESSKNLPPFIVMEYVEGISLSALLKERGALSQAQIIRWALRLCDILSYLHAQTPPVIYRDLKPGNIILRPDGDLALIDFGSARRLRDDAQTAFRLPGCPSGDTVPLGTRGYAAPEQFGGRGQSDARTDIYGLGSTLYHLLIGQSPPRQITDSPPVHAGIRGSTSSLCAIITRCMQPDPAKRYQSCEEVRAALLHCKGRTSASGLRTAVVRIAACAALAAPAVGMGILARAQIADARESGPENRFPDIANESDNSDAHAEELLFYAEFSRRITENRSALIEAGVSERELEEILSYLDAKLSDEAASSP